MQLGDPDEVRPPSNVFALATPYHLLIKLAWEIGQLRSALQTEQKIDGPTARLSLGDRDRCLNLSKRVEHCCASGPREVGR
jgi:hypothetical protein